MRNTRRLAMISLSIVALGALLGDTAVAQAPAAQASASGWSGKANADALTISLFGTTLTTSAATAELNAGFAKATATQVLTPAFTGETSAETSVVGDTQESKPEACTLSELSQLPGLVRSDVVCGSSFAQLTTDGGTARGLGAEVVLEPSVSELLATLQLQEPVQEGVNRLFEEAINPIVENLTGNPVGDLVDSTVATVQDVLNDVLSLESTARIVIAPALAEVTASGNTVVAHARAQGIRIELLPVSADAATNGLLPDDLAPGEPLLTITIGQAEITKTVAKDGGTDAVAKADSALVSIECGTTALTDALGLCEEPIEIAGGQTICVLEGTPLESCVTVANAGVDADGNPFADGTSIQLLKGVNGGIDLATGRAAGSAEPGAEAPLVAEELPRTGGSATLPIVGGGLLALALAARRLAFGRR